jgi:hypothetical protein
MWPQQCRQQQQQQRQQGQQQLHLWRPLMLHTSPSCGHPAAQEGLLPSNQQQQQQQLPQPQLRQLLHPAQHTAQGSMHWVDARGYSRKDLAHAWCLVLVTQR